MFAPMPGPYLSALQMRLQEIDVFIGCANNFGEDIRRSVVSPWRE